MAIEPAFFGDGYTQRRSDPERVVYCKKLGEVQTNLGGSALAANNPMHNDTIRIITQKWLCALNGVAYTG